MVRSVRHPPRHVSAVARGPDAVAAVRARVALTTGGGTGVKDAGPGREPISAALRTRDVASDSDFVDRRPVVGEGRRRGDGDSARAEQDGRGRTSTALRSLHTSTKSFP